jgi:hypothetical protein
VIALENPRVLHRVTPDEQQEVPIVPAREGRDLEILLDVLLGEHGRAGGDLTHQREPARSRRPARPVDQDLDRAGLGRVTLEKAQLLEVPEVRMDRRG